MHFQYKGESQLIDSWLLFYGVFYYCMGTYYWRYTKEFSIYDGEKNVYKESEVNFDGDEQYEG